MSSEGKVKVPSQKPIFREEGRQTGPQDRSEELSVCDAPVGSVLNVARESH